MVVSARVEVPRFDRVGLKAKRVAEGPDSASFYMSRPDGDELPPFEPGQWIDVATPDGLTRSYLLSAFSKRPKTYRITLLRQPGDAPMSRYLLETFSSGEQLIVSGPFGDRLISDGSRPLVVVSRGVGSVAVVTMVEALLQSGSKRLLSVLLAEHSIADLLLGAKIKSLRAEMRDVQFTLVVDDPRVNDRSGRDYDRKGDLHPLALAELLPEGDFEYILCGAAAFVEPLALILRAHGIVGDRLKILSFGELKVEHERTMRVPARTLDPTPRHVVFRRSGHHAIWREQDGTLLDLALARGIELPRCCRTGMCGTCAQLLLSGDVVEVRTTSAQAGHGKILLCSTIPASNLEIDA